MAKNRIQTPLRLEPEMLYKITCIAKENKRSLNGQMEFLAQQCIREYESQNGEIIVDENEAYK